MIDVLKKIGAKQYLEAHTICLDMIRQNVNDPRPYHALGIIAFEHRNFVKAEELYIRATTLDGSNASYWATYAQLLSVLGRQNEARIAAEKAAELEIHEPLTADTIAVVFTRAGFHERAIPFFKKAIEFNDKPANFHYNLGSSLQFSGRFNEAKEAYLATLERDPDFSKAYSGIVALEKQTNENNKLDTLKEYFTKNSSDPDATLHIGHAIAKTYEDLGEHDLSLDWLNRAKAMNKERFPVDLSAQSATFEAAKTTANIEAIDDNNTSDGAPIFVVGLPRTGTTLVDRILSSHPDVIAAGELNVFAAIVKGAANTKDNLVLDAETLSSVPAASLPDIGHHYMNSTKALARGAKRFTDKMPLNFFYAGLICKALPNARIVALRRGAMDSCISNYRQLFSTQYSYYNYTYDLESTANFYKGYDDLMAYWREHLPANQFMEIHYEDIVFDQENQTRNLLKFCDLGWDEACMRFHENKAPVSTASSVQVRQPLYSGSIDRWKKYTTGLDILKQTLGDLAK
ncbi:MAG: sulfotransferase [Kordiimonas sp.]